MKIRVFTIYFSNFLTNLLFAVMAPFYPLTALDKGCSQWQIGLIFCFMPLTTFAVSPFVGQNLKKLGRRRAFSAGNLFEVCHIQFMSMVLIGVSYWMDGYVFFVLGVLARILSGIGAALIFTVGYSIPQSDYPDQLNEILGLIEFYSGLGLMLGPVIGSGLFYLLDFYGLFFMLAAIFLVTAPLIYSWLGPDREYKESLAAEEGGLMSFRIIVNALALGYSMAMIGFLDTSIAPHLASYGVDEVYIGGLLAMTDCAYTLSSFLLSKFMKYLPLVWVLAFGLVVSSVAFYLMGPWEYILPPKLFIVIIGITCLSMGLGTILVATLPNLVEVAVKDMGRQNTDALADGLSSIVSSFMSLGEVVGPIVGGLLVDSFGFGNGAAIMGGSGMLMLFVFLVSERGRMA